MRALSNSHVPCISALQKLLVRAQSNSYVPRTPIDIAAAISADPAMASVLPNDAARTQLKKLAKQLSLICDLEVRKDFRALSDAYSSFNPNTPPVVRKPGDNIDAKFAKFRALMGSALAAAGYKPFTQQQARTRGCFSGYA